MHLAEAMRRTLMVSYDAKSTLAMKEKSLGKTLRPQPDSQKKSAKCFQVQNGEYNKKQDATRKSDLL